MTKKSIEKHTSPYDLNMKGGFNRDCTSLSSSSYSPKMPYDLNRASKSKECYGRLNHRGVN